MRNTLNVPSQRPVALVRHEPIYMLSQVDLTMKLRFLLDPQTNQLIDKHI